MHLLAILPPKILIKFGRGQEEIPELIVRNAEEVQKKDMFMLAS
jgi:hypothetical protein